MLVEVADGGWIYSFDLREVDNYWDLVWVDSVVIRISLRDDY